MACETQSVIQETKKNTPTWREGGDGRGGRTNLYIGSLLDDCSFACCFAPLFGEGGGGVDWFC